MKLKNLNSTLKDFSGMHSERRIKDSFLELLGIAEVKNRTEAQQCDDISQRIIGTSEDSIELSSAEATMMREVLEKMMVKGIVKRFIFSQLDNSIVE